VIGILFAAMTVSGIFLAADWLIPTRIEEHRAINRVTIWVAAIRHQLEMRGDEVRAWLETQLRARLRAGLTDRQTVIDAAEAGCKLSHEILMAEFHELLDVGAMPPASLRAHAARAEKIKHKRGQSWHHDYMRNVCICILIALAAREFDLMATRNREKRRKLQPSGCSVVQAALARNNIHLDEGTVTNLWLGIYGQLVRQNMPLLFPYTTLIP
jgi:hypothetical protein